MPALAFQYLCLEYLWKLLFEAQKRGSSAARLFYCKGFGYQKMFVQKEAGFNSYKCSDVIWMYSSEVLPEPCKY